MERIPLYHRLWAPMFRRPTSMLRSRAPRCSAAEHGHDSAVAHLPPGRYEEARFADAFAVSLFGIRDGLCGTAPSAPLHAVGADRPIGDEQPDHADAPTAGSGLTTGGGLNSRSNRFGSPGTGFGTGAGRTPSAFSAGSPLSGYGSSFSSLESRGGQTGAARIGTNFTTPTAASGRQSCLQLQSAARQSART